MNIGGFPSQREAVQERLREIKQEGERKARRNLWAGVGLGLSLGAAGFLAAGTTMYRNGSEFGKEFERTKYLQSHDIHGCRGCEMYMRVQEEYSGPNDQR